MNSNGYSHSGDGGVRSYRSKEGREIFLYIAPFAPGLLFLHTLQLPE